jgi:acyl-homoserine-lactone acylase
MKNLFLFFLLINITAVGQVKPEDIQIARDSFGVPHIFGKTDADVAYGLAWAHAEDDFYNIQSSFLAGKGMLGRSIGRKGAEADYVVALLRCRDIVKEKMGSISPQFLKQINAYIQGMNDYARTHPAEVRVKSAFPATVEDYLTTVVFSLCMISGLEQALPQIFKGNLPLIPGFEPTGSNAFAIHPNKTTTGEAFLAINSHQPLEGPVGWYEAHLISEEGTNILGALFPGALTVLAGVNESLGWAHTVNNMDKIDVYQLKINPANKNEYEFDGQWIKLESRKIKLKVKGIPVKVGKDALWSKYGPTIRNGKGTFSLRFTANMDIRGMEQWWRMGKSNSFSSFYEAISMQALPLFNIVYADKFDTIFYISAGKMPIRNKNNGYSWNSTLPGNTSATLWDDFHPISDLPQYINPSSGYLFNTNHSPFLATATIDNLNPEKFDKTSDYEMYHNNRSQRFSELITPLEKLDYESFKKIKYDGQLPQHLRYIYNLDTMELIDAKIYPDLSDIILDYQRWDRKSDTGSKGAAIFALFFQYASAKRAEWTNYTLNTNQIIGGLQFVKKHQMQYFGKTGISLGQLQKHIRGDKVIPLWGLPDVLTAMYSRPQPDGTLKGYVGDSYIQLVRFPKNGIPVMETVNAYGASANKNSPHYTDQMDLFVNKQTKSMTLDKEKVLKEAVKVYYPGQK